MSTHSPRLQFVTGLPDSPKTNAKEVILVKGSWYETLGSPRLPFDLNQPLLFSGLSLFCCMSFWYVSHFPRSLVY